ncbi:MAG: alanine:cation symporter family protein, partial [Eggerthellaceae bacterium]
MEEFLVSFFIEPFTGLATGIAGATSPLDVIDAIDGFVWGPIMIMLLLFTHVFMTIRTGFIQRKIGTGIRLSVTKDDPSDADGDITQFGALTTALAATIGTGNIVGVGTGL